LRIERLHRGKHEVLAQRALRIAKARGPGDTPDARERDLGPHVEEQDLLDRAGAPPEVVEREAPAARGADGNQEARAESFVSHAHDDRRSRRAR
jgi:hypothetical protein